MGRWWLSQPVVLACGLYVASGTSGQASEAPAFASRPRPAAASSTTPARLPVEATGPVRASLERVEVLEPGTSDRRALQVGRAALPLHRLTPANRRRAEQVLAQQSMFRALPVLRLDVDHDSYRYFVEHPDVAVSIWRVLGVSQCQLWQTGPDSYESDVGDGTTGVMDVLLRDRTDHVVVAEGQFKSPMLLKPIRAVALLHLKSDYVTRRDGEPEVHCRGYLYVTFPSQTVETAAKVVSPVTNMVIDRNFEEIGLFAQMMSAAMRSQPGWVEYIASRMDGVLERRRGELLQVTATTYVTAKKRELSREGFDVSPEEILPPLRGVTPTSRLAP
jgi:hypothetical protein